MAIGLLFPNTEFMLFPLPVQIKAKYIVLGLFVYEVYSEILSKTVDNIAHWAHFGGMIFAFIMIQIWKRDSWRHGARLRRGPRRPAIPGPPPLPHERVRQMVEELRGQADPRGHHDNLPGLPPPLHLLHSMETLGRKMEDKVAETDR